MAVKKRSNKAKGTTTPPKNVVEEPVVAVSEEDELRQGVLPDGKLFDVPHTTDVAFRLVNFKTLTRPMIFIWALIIFNLSLAFSGVSCFWLGAFYLFWRCCYNIGLGYILDQQSKTQLLTRWVGALMKKPDHPMTKRLEALSKSGMDPQYDFWSSPAALNAWLLYRHLVDVILVMDFASYVIFGLASLPSISFPFLPSRLPYTVVGMALWAFNIWCKADAHRVVRDYAWYWGDFFFLIKLKQDLVFNGVFELFPHPMYTVGYAFYYGSALFTNSASVFYVSVAAHLMQLVFLAAVESPHIEKTYNAAATKVVEEKEFEGAGEAGSTPAPATKAPMRMFNNIDFLCATDVFTLVIVAFGAMAAMGHTSLTLFWVVVVARVLFTTVLSACLSKQSESDWIVKKFQADGQTRQDAYNNWQVFYNAATSLNHVLFWTFAMVSFTSASWGALTLRLVSGSLLLGLNLWASAAAHDVVGDIGYFYGDFFFPPSSCGKPGSVENTGIYRYLNNPESVIGFTGYYGAGIISGSQLVFSAGIACQILHLLFVHFVERPHMHRVYGSESTALTGVAKKIAAALPSNLTPKLDAAEEAVESTFTVVSRSAKSLRGGVKGSVTKLAGVADAVVEGVKAGSSSMAGGVLSSLETRLDLGNIELDPPVPTPGMGSISGTEEVPPISEEKVVVS